MQAVAACEARWGFGTGRCGSVGHSELGTVVLLMATWWDLRLVSLLTHLFMHSVLVCYFCLVIVFV